MIDYERIFAKIAPFDLDRAQKGDFLTRTLKELTAHHCAHSAAYRKIMDAQGFDLDTVHSYSELPFLPARLFKEYKLVSAGEDSLVKMMKSSGTTGQRPSMIFVDKQTSVNQSKVMAKIVSSFLPAKRMPMLIIDSEAVNKDRDSFTARAGAIRGFQMFGSDKLYALDEDMNLRLDAVQAFLEKHAGEAVFLFGFTFMIWLHFCGELERLGVKLPIDGGVLIHGGGWKKLADQAITRDRFKETIFARTGIERVHDYYGMVEQGSSIYTECAYGHLHASAYSDVIIRRGKDFSIADFGEEGIIQALSISPVSYPGHSILTEDKGIMLGEDDCLCGRKGKYFEVTGRIAEAETRGCGDTYEH